MNNKRVGVLGEEESREYLKSKGYSILFRNKKIAGVEIDIIAQKGDVIVFCEVKSRESDKYGRGIEAINAERIKRYARAGKLFMAGSAYKNSSLRFDVIELNHGVLNHVEDAFRL